MWCTFSCLRTFTLKITKLYAESELNAGLKMTSNLTVLWIQLYNLLPEHTPSLKLYLWLGLNKRHYAPNYRAWPCGSPRCSHLFVGSRHVSGTSCCYIALGHKEHQGSDSQNQILSADPLRSWFNSHVDQDCCDFFEADDPMQLEGRVSLLQSSVLLVRQIWKLSCSGLWISHHTSKNQRAILPRC